MYGVAHLMIPGLGSTQAAVPVEVTLETGMRCVCEQHHVHELACVRALSEQQEPPTAQDSFGLVLRVATEADLQRDTENREVERNALAAFRGYLDERRVPARPIRAHLALRGERLVLWYAAEEMLDLRTELGHLQRQFSTRVEVHQVGPRDAAGMLGGCGVCGRSLCCATWLQQFQSISLRMARDQDLSLMPAAVNGMCGCLKCCLRYEVDQYREASVGLPAVGARVRWRDGEGSVVTRDVLAHRVTVRDEGRFATLPAADVEEAPGTTRRGADPGRVGERQGRP